MVQFRGYQDDPENTAIDFSYLVRLWPYVRPYRGGFLLALGILFASFGLEVLGPYLMRLTIDGPITTAVQSDGLSADQVSGLTGDIALLGGFYLLVTLGSVALGYWFAMLTARNGQSVIRDVRVGLFHHILQLSPRFFDRNPAGKLVTRVTSDIENLNELISTGVLQTIFDLIKIVGILAVLMVLDVQLALIPLLATPVLIVVSLVFRKYVRRSYRKVRGRTARQNAFTAEAVGGVRVTRMFGQEDTVSRHYSELNRDTKNAWLETVFHFASFVSAIDVLLRVTQVGILFAGGTMIAGGTLTAGVFVQFWLLFQKLTEPIRELGEKYNVLQSAFASSERIFGILDEEIEPQSPADPTPTGRGAADLRFQNVSFSYLPGRPVLDDVSFEVEPGQTVAIVGPTGAGKTTVLSLVSRLYDPQAGDVLLDDVALPRLDLTATRRRIAVVPQDVFLFTGTVLDNLRLFDESIPEDRVRAALDTIGALDWVESLDGGLQAEVQERGAGFSQGERQLLAFARALAADPDLLVLDEATANIDNESEELIQSGLRRLLRDRTSLIVAHRLSTVRDAHQILVMQGGRIVERGTHGELLGQDGAYAAMVRHA